MEEIKPKTAESKYGFERLSVGESVEIEKSAKKIRPLLSYFMKRTAVKYTTKANGSDKCVVVRIA